MNRKLVRWLLIGIGLAVYSPFLMHPTLLLGGGEQYLPFWPTIDTRFAPGFTEEKFASIIPGMTEAQVRAVLGEPLSLTPERNVFGTPITKRSLSYSSDGAAPFGDFAWLGREVLLVDGKVTGTRRHIYRD